jgi:glucosyl-3-phosphoglycerate synthase
VTLPAPEPGLQAVVVVPARDEEARIGACLEALVRQAPTFEILVVLDGCRDGTADRVREVAARHPRVPVHALPVPAQGVGAARRLGMERACRRLLAVGRPRGLIACTDADSVVAPDWLEAQLALVARGAHAVGGRIELAPEEAAALEVGVLARRAAQGRVRLAAVRAAEPNAEHHQFSGASMGITAEAYRSVGGLPALAALEDEAMEGRLRRHGVPIARSSAVRVWTSARTSGRAPRGLAADLAVLRWADRRRYRGDGVSVEELRAAKGATTVSVVLPAREVADTIGGVLDAAVMPLVAAEVVDEVLVVDAGSTDGTAEVAAARGVRVLDEDRILPGHGPALGKGDAMWRALAVTTGDVMCFLDADTSHPAPWLLSGLLRPLLSDLEVQLVKGAFDRPFESARPHEGGRVTELMARPLLNLHFPELAGFAQPLAGEIAARRALLERLAFPAGYGVEIAMLIDALRLVGLDGLAEVDLGTRQNRHQPLRDLGEMAYAVLAAVEARIDGRASAGGHYVRPWDDFAVARVPVLERPPLASPDRAAAVD